MEAPVATPELPPLQAKKKKNSGKDEEYQDLDQYPDVTFKLVLLHCDKSAILQAMMACKKFHQVCDSEFGFDKCLLDGVTIPPAEWRQFAIQKELKIDYMFIYRHHNPYGENVLWKLWNRHPNKHEGLIEKFASLERTCMFTESPPINCQMNFDVHSCWTTISARGERVIDIDLVSLGVQEWILDHFRPRITVTELHAPTLDSSCYYEFYAQLLNGREVYRQYHVDVGSIRFKRLKRNYDYDNNGEWVEETLVFENYPIGMRVLAIASAGEDLDPDHESDFWNYREGVKFANTSVRIEFVGEPRYLTAADYPDTKVDNRPLPRRLPKTSEELRRERMAKYANMLSLDPAIYP